MKDVRILSTWPPAANAQERSALGDGTACPTDPQTARGPFDCAPGLTRTVASSRPSPVSGPSLPELAAIAARFLPSAQNPPATVPDPPSSTQATLSSRLCSWRETSGDPDAPGSHRDSVSAHDRPFGAKIPTRLHTPNQPPTRLDTQRTPRHPDMSASHGLLERRTLKIHTTSGTTDPCPVLALATVRLDAHTRTWCKFLPKMEGWFSQPNFRQLTRLSELVAQRPLSSCGTAEQGTRTCALAAVFFVATLPPAAQESLNKEIARPLPSPEAPFFCCPEVVPSISPEQCHEPGPHTPRRRSLLQQYQH